MNKEAKIENPSVNFPRGNCLKQPFKWTDQFIVLQQLRRIQHYSELQASRLRLPESRIETSFESAAKVYYQNVQMTSEQINKMH